MEKLQKQQQPTLAPRLQNFSGTKNLLLSNSLLLFTYRQKFCQTKTTVCITIDILWKLLERSLLNSLSPDQNLLCFTASLLSGMQPLPPGNPNHPSLQICRMTLFYNFQWMSKLWPLRNTLIATFKFLLL